MIVNELISEASKWTADVGLYVLRIICMLSVSLSTSYLIIVLLFLSSLRIWINQFSRFLLPVSQMSCVSKSFFYVYCIHQCFLLSSSFPVSTLCLKSPILWLFTSLSD